MENSRILVTGGSGFIGTNFVEHCIRQGAVVQNVDLAEPVIATHRPHWKKISILDEAALTAAFVAFKPNYVVHLSARTDLDGKDLEAYAANILGTELVARAAVAAGCRRVIFTSTKLVNRNGYCPKDDFDYCPDTLYGESKVIAEQRLRNFAFGATDWALVRPTSIWGPWSELPHIPYGRFFRMIESGRYFHIRGMDAKKSFGYVGNAIAQIEAVMTSSTPLNGEVFYLVDYEETYIHQWAEVIREAFGAPAIRTMPRSVAVLGARVGDLVKKVTGREMPINSRRLRNMSLDTSAVPLASIQRLCPELPYDLEKGVRETVDWFRSQKKPARTSQNKQRRSDYTMSSPLISLIVPSWQSGEYLEQTILSVLAQNYERVELILVDNESTDQTKEIIDIYRDHFTRIIVEPDRGQSDAINKGMALATGDILGWLNADDILLEDCLSRIARAFEQEKPDILTTDTIYIDENNKITKFSLQPRQRPYFYRRGILFLTAPSIFFSRQAYSRVAGGLNEDLRLSMDVDLCYTIIANGGKVHHMRGYCGAFRWHSDSKTFVDLSGRSTRENTETRSVFQKFQISDRTRALAHRLHQIRLVLGLYPLRRRLDAARYGGKFRDFLRELERNRRVTPQQNG